MKLLKNSIARVVLVGLTLILQIAWLVVQLTKLHEYYPIIAVATTILALLVELRIYGSRKNSAFKISWFFFIMLFPIMGILCYALSGYSLGGAYIKKRFAAAQERRIEAMRKYAQKESIPEGESEKLVRQNEYIDRFGTYPAHRNSDIEYFPNAAAALEAQKEALRGAEKFIFMEYFAIEDSIAFSEIKRILAEKVRQGVEVRMLYDDAGSIGFINHSFLREMKSLGVDCRVFNPILPILNLFMNHRDHRKITVVDGKTGFTGGYNLADEYFNIVQPFGHWKDTGVKIKGDAVQNLTGMFLEMWDAMSGTETDYAKYFIPTGYEAKERCCIQPYADSPLDNERVGEIVYLNMIKGATRYVHIVTPYLILDDETISELTLAAKRGVEVCILTPGIPDKKLVYQLTRSYYSVLADCGVRIFEYTPGFPHAKMAVCDDESAVVGTINLDYRSLYLHFEDAVFLYGCTAVNDIEKDFQKTIAQGCEVTEKYQNRKQSLLIVQSLLRLFAPLM